MAEVSKSQLIRDYLEANPGAMPKEVVAALAVQGVEVSSNSVYNVKWELKGGKGGKKAAKPAAKAAKAEPAPKAPAVDTDNKTQAIKDYLTANPKAMPKAVADALKAQGVDVTPTYVSAIKFKMKAKAKRRGRKPGRKPAAAPPAAAAAPASDAISLAALLEAKKLVAKLGSVDQAKQALSALAQLAD